MKSLKRTTVWVMALTIIVKAAGFLRDIVLSYYYGASYITDAYIISLTIPIVIFSFVSMGLSTSLIPSYTKIKNKQGKQSADDFLSRLIIFLGYSTTILIGIILVIPSFAVKIFTANINEQTLEMASLLTRINIFSLYPLLLFAMFSGYLQINNQFRISSIAPLGSHITSIVGFYLSTIYSLTFLGYTTVLGFLIQLLIIIPFVKQKKYKFKYHFKRNDKELKYFLSLASPVIIGSSITQLNLLVDRYIASGLGEGRISALEYSSKLIQFANGIIAVSIAITMYPLITNLLSTEKIKEAQNQITSSLINVVVYLSPISVLILIFSEEIVEVLFGRGAFDDFAVSLTASSLFFYAIGLVFLGLREVISRAFFAHSNTKLPMINASLFLLVNIFLSVSLSKQLGVGGVALATSITSILSFFSLLHLYIRKIGVLKIQKMFYATTKVFISLLCMFFSIYILDKIFLAHGLTYLVTLSIIGLIFYFLSLEILKKWKW